jgi:predicted CoA-binding protein
MNKKTVVIGASDNSERYAYKAASSLQQHGHSVVPVGLREGNINGLAIITEKVPVADVHTVTMYVGAKNQADWIPYILSLKPQRIVFNPGTENPDFEVEAQTHGIETLEACTLVMLSIGNY